MLRSAETGTGLSFQKIWPPPSMRSRTGSGGSTGFCGGFVERCGRSMSIGYDSCGAVTMKMMSSTSITSQSGMMLMSAIGPSPEPEEKAMVQTPVQLVLAGGDEAHLAHASSLREVDDFLHHPVLRGLVRTYVDRRLRRLLRLDGQGTLQQLEGDRLVVEEHVAVVGHRDRDRHRRGRGVGPLVQVGLRELDLDLVGHQRRRDHEDDQEHQHHVDQRHDVDRGVDLVMAVTT